MGIFSTEYVITVEMVAVLVLMQLHALSVIAATLSKTAHAVDPIANTALTPLFALNALSDTSTQMELAYPAPIIVSAAAANQSALGATLALPYKIMPVSAVLIIVWLALILQFVLTARKAILFTNPSATHAEEGAAAALMVWAVLIVRIPRKDVLIFHLHK